VPENQVHGRNGKIDFPTLTRLSYGETRIPRSFSRLSEVSSDTGSEAPPHDSDAFFIDVISFYKIIIESDWHHDIIISDGFPYLIHNHGNSWWPTTSPVSSLCNQAVWYLSAFPPKYRMNRRFRRKRILKKPPPDCQIIMGLRLMGSTGNSFHKKSLLLYLKCAAGKDESFLRMEKRTNNAIMTMRRPVIILSKKSVFLWSFCLCHFSILINTI